MLKKKGKQKWKIKTENRKWKIKTENRKWKTEGRRQKIENRKEDEYGNICGWSIVAFSCRMHYKKYDTG